MATKREKEYEEAAAQRGGAGRGNEASDTDPAPGKPKRPAGGEASGAADVDKPAGGEALGGADVDKPAGGEAPGAADVDRPAGGEAPGGADVDKPAGGEAPGGADVDKPAGGEAPGQKQRNGKQATEPGGEKSTAKGKAAEPGGEKSTAKGKATEPGGGGKPTASGTEKEPGKSPGGQTRALEKIWSRRMALIGLKRIYETALEGARIEIRDEDGALVEVKFNPSAANAATKAIEAANKMLGYAAPEEEKAGASLFSVELGEAEDFAE